MLWIFILLGWAASPVLAENSFIASIYPLQLILSELAPGQVSKDPLLQPGSSPHTHELKPSQVKRLSDSLGVFYVAPSLDEWASHTPMNHSHAWLDFLPAASRLLYGKGVDAHFWVDPLSVRESLPLATQTLCTLLPLECASIQKRSKTFSDKLTALDHTIRTSLSKVVASKPRLVLSHPFLRYYLNRYGIEVVTIVHNNCNQEVQLRGFLTKLKSIKELHPRALLTLMDLPSSGISLTTLSEETGLPIIPLDPYGSPSTTPNYATLLLNITGALKKGLQ